MSSAPEESRTKQLTDEAIRTLRRTIHTGPTWLGFAAVALPLAIWLATILWGGGGTREELRHINGNVKLLLPVMEELKRQQVLLLAEQAHITDDLKEVTERVEDIDKSVDGLRSWSEGVKVKLEM